VADVKLATTVVDTVKVAVLLPAGTVTLLRTVAAALLLESVTGVPPVGAKSFRVTVPVELLPPTTVLGLRDTLSSIGFSVNPAEEDRPPNDAVIVAEVMVVTV